MQPYEYYRRTPADGELLLQWLAVLAPDSASWERRRECLLTEAREALALDPFLRGVVADPDVRLGREVRHDGYTMQNYALETLPGLYVCGTIYAPLAKGPHPLIVSPAGHWEGGRCRPDQQLRMATFARMGAVAVDMDIFGWGDSERQVGREAHTQHYSMQLQALWSKRVTDWMVASRRDIDTTRMAATGGSGGATHALQLALLDDRFAALAPVVHLVSHFDGGLPVRERAPGDAGGRRELYAGAAGRGNGPAPDAGRQRRRRLDFDLPDAGIPLPAADLGLLRGGGGGAECPFRGRTPRLRL